MRIAAWLVLLTSLLLAGVVVLRSPWGSATQDRSQFSAESSRTHPLGTDELGRDRLARTAAALLLGMAGAAAASALATGLSLALAAFAAFVPPWAGAGLLYLGDLFLTLPWLFLLMLVRSALPLNLAPLVSVTVTFALLALLGVPAFLRLHYTRLQRLRGAAWRVQDRAAGIRDRHRLQRLLPHVRPLAATQFLLYVPACLVAEANMGTLGLGISEPLASWGSMLQSMQQTLLLSPSRLLFIPLLLLVLVLACLELLMTETPGASA